MEQLFIENFRSPETVLLQSAQINGKVTIDKKAVFGYADNFTSLQYPIDYLPDFGKSDKVFTLRYKFTFPDDVADDQENTLLFIEYGAIKFHIYLHEIEFEDPPVARAAICFDYTDSESNLYTFKTNFYPLLTGESVNLNIVFDRVNHDIIVFDDEEIINPLVETLPIDTISGILDLIEEATEFHIGGRPDDLTWVFRGVLYRVEIWNDAYTLAEYQAMVENNGIGAIDNPRLTVRWALANTYGRKDVPVAALLSPRILSRHLTLVHTHTLQIEDNEEDYEEAEVTYENYHVDASPLEPRLFGEDFLLTDRVYNKTAYYYEYELRYDAAATQNNIAPVITLRNQQGRILPAAQYAVEYCDVNRRQEYEAEGNIVTPRYTKYDIEDTPPNTAWAKSWGITLRPTDVGTRQYRVRLLLPETVVGTSDTWFVYYSRMVKRTIDEQPFLYAEAYWEIINPRPLYTYGDHYKHYNTEYSHIVFPMVYEPDTARGVSGIRAWKIRDRQPTPQMPQYAKWQTWSPRVLRGAMKINGVYYRVNNRHDDSYTEDAYHGRVSLESAAFLSPSQIQAIHTPLIVLRAETSETGYPTYDVLQMTDLRPTGPSCPDGDGSLIIYVNGEPLSGSLIRDVDEWNGIVHFTRAMLRPSDKIQVSYKYLQEYVYIHSLDLNPFAGHRRVGLPEGTTVFDTGATLYLNPLSDDPGERISLLWKWDVGSSYYDVSDITTIPTIIPDADTLPFAMFTIHEIKPEDLYILDIRRGGGGIDADVIHPERRSFTDIGWYDGQPIPGSAAAIRISVTYLNKMIAYYQSSQQISEETARHQAIRWFAANAAQYVQGDALMLRQTVNDNAFTREYAQAELNIYPANHPLAGIHVTTNDPLEALRQNAPIIAAVFTEQESQIIYNSCRYRGIIAELILTAASSGMFNALALDPISDQTCRILRIDAQDGDNWVPMQHPDGSPIVNVPFNRGAALAILPTQSRRMRITLHQPDYTIQHTREPEIIIDTETAETQTILYNQEDLSCAAHPFYRYTIGIEPPRFYRARYAATGTHVSPLLQAQDGALSAVTLAADQMFDAAGRTGVWHTLEMDGQDGAYREIPILPYSLGDRVAARVDSLYPTAVGAYHYCILPYPAQTLLNLYINGRTVSTAGVIFAEPNGVAIRSVLRIPDELIPSADAKVAAHYVPVVSGLGYTVYVFHYNEINSGYNLYAKGSQPEAHALDFRQMLLCAGNTNPEHGAHPGEFALNLHLPLRELQLQHTIDTADTQFFDLPTYPYISGYDWETKSFAQNTQPVTIYYYDALGDQRSYRFMDRTNYEDPDSPQLFTSYGYQYYLTRRRIVFNNTLAVGGVLTINYRTLANGVRLRTHLFSLDSDKTPVVKPATIHLVPQLW